jgi:hypothetical protein
MNLVVKNKEELDQWIEERREQGIDIFSVKGEPPDGATYDGVDPILNPVNVAWTDDNGGIIDIEYKLEPHCVETLSKLTGENL